MSNLVTKSFILRNLMSLEFLLNHLAGKLLSKGRILTELGVGLLWEGEKKIRNEKKQKGESRKLSTIF